MQTEIIKEKLEALSGAILALAESFEETETPKKAKGKKAKEVEESNDDMGFGEEETEETEATLDDVKKAFKDYVKNFGDVKKGRAAAMKILKKLKVSTLDDLEESQYQEAIDLVS